MHVHEMSESCMYLQLMSLNRWRILLMCWLALLLQFYKMPLDIALDTGRHDLLQLMQQLSVCITSHVSNKTCIAVHTTIEQHALRECVG